MANALSIYGDILLDCITSPVVLTNPFTGEKISTKGIWDTGATNSVITKSSARKLGLIPISRAVVNGVHGEREVNVYYVNITLNNNQITLNTQVTECEELSPDHTNGMLIGMNVITLGDFSITNFDDRTVMSFVVPSQKKTDFVAEIKEYNRLFQIHESRIKVGNNLCPCGSKKQWENCHGKKTFR